MIRNLFIAGLAGLFVIVSTPAAFSQDDPVVARVDGQEIKRSDVMNARESIPEQYREIPIEQIFPVLITSMIDSKLVAADARSRNLHEEEAFKEQLQRVVDQLLERYAVGKIIEEALTDEALRKRYDEQAGKGGDKEVHARHILVETKDAALAVIKELDQGGDFVALAKSKSTGPSGPRGGDLGFFGKGQMVPEFEQAAFDLETGKYTKEPVQTQFGFHVIKVEETRQAPLPSFEESANRLRAEAAQQAGATYVEGLRASAKIEQFNLDGSPR